MKQIEKIATAENFTAVNIGNLSELGEYVLQFGPEIKIPGKIFGGTALHTTGGEFSFQLFQPGTETGFLHSHKKHEELYFFLAGLFIIAALIFAYAKLPKTTSDEKLEKSPKAMNVLLIIGAIFLPVLFADWAKSVTGLEKRVIISGSFIIILAILF